MWHMCWEMNPDLLWKWRRRSFKSVSLPLPIPAFFFFAVLSIIAVNSLIVTLYAENTIVYSDFSPCNTKIKARTAIL